MMTKYMNELKEIYKNTDDQEVKDALIRIIATILSEERQPIDLSRVE